MATKNIVPRADLEGGIGTDAKKWASGSFGRVNVSSYVSGSAVSTASFGTYRGDGSQLTGITSGIFQTTGSVEATTNDLQITGSLSLDSTAFKYGASTWKEVSGVNEFTGSTWEFQANKGSGTLFNVVDNSNNLVFRAQQDKVFVFGAVDGAEPTAIAGGLMYSGSDAWYLGYENDPK
tara:strand:+ start:694 stop:1227 length:534 start_codon:yes stop_codon:yes gene_type:complete